MIIRSFDFDGCQIGVDRFKSKDNEPIKIAWSYIHLDLAVLKIEGNGKDIFQSLGSFCVLRNFNDPKVSGLANAAIWFADRGYDVEIMATDFWPLHKISIYKANKATEKLHAHLWKKHSEAHPRCCTCKIQDETVKQHEDTGILNWCDKCYGLKQTKDKELAGGENND